MLNLKFKMQNLKWGSPDRRHLASCILHLAFVSFLILHFAFYIPIPALAVEVRIVTPPTGSCPTSIPTCKLGYCFTDEAAKGVSSEAQAKQVSGIPCNYTLDDLVQAGVNVANFIFTITGSLMLLFVVYGGYQLLTSMGNPEEIKKARATLTAAFIGVIIILAATLLVRFVGDLIGAKFGGDVHLERTIIPE